MESGEQARSWADLFPSHAAGWLIVSAIVAVALVSKPRMLPQSAQSSEPAPRLEEKPLIRDVERARRYAWLSRKGRETYEPLSRRVPPPDGFKLVDLTDGSFGDWLRHLPARPPDSPVLSGNKKLVKPGDARDVAVVIDLQPGNNNLLNAANIALRLRAEYLWTAVRGAQASFTFTNGEAFAWDRWSAGERPIVQGRSVEWRKAEPTGDDRDAYVGFMETLFRYSSVYSLFKDTRPVSDETIQPGDVFVLPGRPGHAIVVLDVAVHPRTRQVMALLGHGGTPPQTFHVVRAGGATPWFEVRAGSNLHVPPHWPLQMKQLRRW